MIEQIWKWEHREVHLPAGQWNDEPDKVQFQDVETGYPCLIVRGPLGALCGYVGIESTHPLYGMDSSDERADVFAHGGVNFSGKCRPTDDPAQGVCHLPAEGETDDVWWFGFDCAHSGDIIPGPDTVFGGEDMRFTVGDTYKSIKYVKSEIADLAGQLKGKS